MIVIDEFDIIQGSIFTITDAYFGILVISFQMKRKAHTRGAFLPTEKRLMRQQRAVHSSSAQRH